MKFIFVMLKIWMIEGGYFVFNVCQHLLKATLQAVLWKII